MGGKTAFALLVLVLEVSSGAALQCHVCKNGGMCNSGEIGSLTQCPAQQGDVQFNHCFKFDGETVVTVEGQTGGFKGVVRSCYGTSASVDSPPLRCLTDGEIDDYAQYLFAQLPSTFTLPPDLSYNFKGNLCFCADKDGCNGVGSFQPFLLLSLTLSLLVPLLK